MSDFPYQSLVLFLSVFPSVQGSTSVSEYIYLQGNHKGTGFNLAEQEMRFGEMHRLRDGRMPTFLALTVGFEAHLCKAQLLTFSPTTLN